MNKDIIYFEAVLLFTVTWTILPWIKNNEAGKKYDFDHFHLPYLSFLLLLHVCWVLSPSTLSPIFCNHIWFLLLQIKARGYEMVPETNVVKLAGPDRFNQMICSAGLGSCPWHIILLKTVLLQTVVHKVHI